MFNYDKYKLRFLLRWYVLNTLLNKKIDQTKNVPFEFIYLLKAFWR